MGFISFVEKLKVKPSETATINIMTNPDLLPMPAERRIWGWFGFLFYWLISKCLISTWTSANSLLSLGFNVGEIMGIIIISNVIVVVLSLANGQIGSDYYIGYTVATRIIFGIHGSYFGVAIRTILSIVWFASQSWLGGLCVCCVLSSWSKSFLYMENTFPDSVHFTSQELVGFVIFQLLCLPLILIKPEKLKPHIVSSSLVTLAAMLGIIIAATKANGGTGPLMTSKTTISGSTYSWNWVYGIVSQYGSIAAGVTNMADYTRFSEKKYSPYPGTIISWFTLGVVIPLMGLITASAIEGRYGVTYWKPNDIMNLWLEDNYTPAVRAGVFFASMAFVSSQLVYNVMGNAIPGGMDMSGLCPQFINIRRGAYITALLSWVIQPWDFYNTSSTFVTVMSSFSVFMTPLIACWICDYFIIRKRKLKLSDLYSLEEGGEFWYWKGLNLRGLLAWACSSAPGIAGLVNQANTDLPISEGAKHFYDGNLFFGFVIAFFVYYVSNLIFPMKKLDELDQVDYFKIYTPEQIQQKGLISYEEYKAGVLPQEDDSVESGSASGSKEITQIEYELTGDKTATVEV